MTSRNLSSIICLYKDRDMSPYLFHFTKGEKPLQNLCRILKENVLKSSEHSYICFTETPLLAMKDILDYFSRYTSPFFEPYGIGIKKVLIFDLGARPVIYGSNDELAKLDESLRWRFELLDFSNHDFIWQREWRIKGNEFYLPEDNEDVLIICRTEKEAEKLKREFGHPCVSFQWIEESQSTDEEISLKVSWDTMSEFELECLKIECEELAKKHTNEQTEYT